MLLLAYVPTAIPSSPTNNQQRKIMRSKEAVAIVASTGALALLTSCSSPAGDAPEAPDSATVDRASQTVCILQNSTSSIITELFDGVQAGLRDEIDAGLSIELQNAQGDARTGQTIASQYVNGDCTVIVTASTPDTQVLANLTDTIPVIFAASNNPSAIGSLDSLDEPGANVTGVSNTVSVEGEIDAMREIFPDMESVGLIWKNGDANADARTEQAKEHLDSLGISYVDAPIQSGADVTQAVQSLAGEVDAIQLPGDITTLAANDAIIAVANSEDLPVFGNNAARNGAVVNVAFEYGPYGEEYVAPLIIEILNGADPATTAVVRPPADGFAVNEKAAEMFDLTIPAEILDSAVETF